jgi:hypothetical protein
MDGFGHPKFNETCKKFRVMSYEFRVMSYEFKVGQKKPAIAICGFSILIGRCI